jgi:hypothetical protein
MPASMLLSPRAISAVPCVPCFLQRFEVDAVEWQAHFGQVVVDNSYLGNFAHIVVVRVVSTVVPHGADFRAVQMARVLVVSMAMAPAVHMVKVLAVSMVMVPTVHMAKEWALVGTNEPQNGRIRLLMACRLSTEQLAK